MTRPRAVLVAALVVVALLLQGCIGIESTRSSQAEVLGPVRLTTVACANGYGCLARANNGSYFPGGSSTGIQLLYAVRLPLGTTAPATFTTRAPSGEDVAMTRNASYEQQLQLYAPAGAGERWWGYLSSAHDYSQQSGQQVTLDLDVVVGPGPDGSLPASPLPWRPVVAARMVEPLVGLLADRPVDCVPSDKPHGSATAVNFEDNPDRLVHGTIVCIDAPLAEDVGGSLTAPYVGLSVTGTPATVAPGSTAAVTWTLRRSGTATGPEPVTLSAAGGPADSALVPSAASVPLTGAVEQTVTVPVAVPAGTAPGSYPVRLTARTAAGRTVSGVAPLVVAVPPSPVPAGGTPAAAPADAVRPVVTRAQVVSPRTARLTSSEAVTVTAVARRLPAGPTRTITRVVPAGRSTVRLPRLPPGRYRLVLRAVDPAGNQARRTTLRLTVPG